MSEYLAHAKEIIKDNIVKFKITIINPGINNK